MKYPLVGEFLCERTAFGDLDSCRFNYYLVPALPFFPILKKCTLTVWMSEGDTLIG